MSPIADNADDPQKVLALTATAKDTIKKRQKLKKLADKNKDGWLVVEEYESDDLASDTDDEKRIKACFPLDGILRAERNFSLSCDFSGGTQAVCALRPQCITGKN